MAEVVQKSMTAKEFFAANESMSPCSAFALTLSLLSTIGYVICTDIIANESNRSLRERKLADDKYDSTKQFPYSSHSLWG
jgi:hypothetical protein